MFEKDQGRRTTICGAPCGGGKGLGALLGDEATLARFLPGDAALLDSATGEAYDAAGVGASVGPRLRPLTGPAWGWFC